MNAYEIYLRHTGSIGTKRLINGDAENLKLNKCTLDTELNAAGKMTLVMPRNHALYSYFDEPYKQYVDVCVVADGYPAYASDNPPIWRGRCIGIKLDQYGRKTIEFEGMLATLNDIYIVASPFQSLTTDKRSLLYYLQQICNSFNLGKTRDIEKFYMDTTGTNALNYMKRKIKWYNENAMTAINKYILERWRGFFAVSYSDNGQTLKWTRPNPYPNTVCSQQIVFGDNLIKAVRDLIYNEVCSGIVVQGAELENSDAYNQLNSYVKWDSDLVAKFGHIEKLVKASDADTQDEMNDVADTELAIIKNKIGAVYNVECIDKAFLPNGTAFNSMFKVGMRATLKPDPAGSTSYTLPISKISVDIVKPANVKMTLGYGDRTKLTQVKG